MKRKLLALTLGLSGSALAAALVLPVVAQESLLPEGFGAPAPAPAPTPAPSPKATETPKGTPPLVPPVAATLPGTDAAAADAAEGRSEEHTSELQSLMRNSYAVFCFKKNNHNTHQPKQAL